MAKPTTPTKPPKPRRKYTPKADAPPKVPYHEQVATKLIEQLEAGTAPWQRPWTPRSLSLPHNPVSGTKYRGSNVVWLQMQGHADPRWMTYKQAASVGAQVRKGEHGTLIQYWKMSDRVLVLDDAGKPVMRDGEKVYRNVKLERPKSFTSIVFNASQIDGLPPLTPSVPNWDRHDRAEALLQATGADIRHDQADEAFYRPSTDRIHMPTREQFPNADAYYGTAFHEVGHWTGHPSRLARDLAHPFRSEGYAKEELRAEIASLMLGDELGIGHDPGQHAAYVKSWIKALKEDPKEILRASKDADRIAAYVLAFEKEREVAPETQTVGVPGATPDPTPAGAPAPVPVEASTAGAPGESVGPGPTTVPPTTAGAPAPVPVEPTPAPAGSTALHTEIPAHGLPVLPEDLTGTWPTAAVERVAADAAQAVTERQRQPEQVTVPGDPEPHQVAPPLLYAYVLPATDTHHGAMRLIPEEQQRPEGWDRADSGGLRPGLMTDTQLQAILLSIATREHVISTATVPTPSAEAPVQAQPTPVAATPTAPPTPPVAPAAEGEIPNDVRLRLKGLLIRPVRTAERLEHTRKIFGAAKVAEVWADDRPAVAAGYDKIARTLDTIADPAIHEKARQHIAERLPASYVTAAEAAHYPDGRAADLPHPDWVRAPAAPAPVAAPPPAEAPAPDYESAAAIQVRLQGQVAAIFERLKNEHAWLPSEGGDGLQKTFANMKPSEPAVQPLPEIPPDVRERLDGWVRPAQETAAKVAEIRSNPLLGARYAAEHWMDARPSIAALYDSIPNSLRAIDDDTNREAARQYLVERIPKSYVTPAEADFFRDGKSADIPTPEWARDPMPVPNHQDTLTIRRDGPTLIVMHGALLADRFGIARDANASYADTVNTDVNGYVHTYGKLMGASVRDEKHPGADDTVNISAKQNFETVVLLSSLQKDHGWTIAEDGRTATKRFENMRHPTTANESTAASLRAYRHSGALCTVMHGETIASSILVSYRDSGTALAARVSAEADAYVARFRNTNGLPDPGNQERGLHPAVDPATGNPRYATAAGEQLAIALERRDLKQALDVLRPLSVKNAQIAAIDAGLSVGRSKNKPEFFADIQSQLLQATRPPERVPLAVVAALEGQDGKQHNLAPGNEPGAYWSAKTPARQETQPDKPPARPKVARER